MQPTATSPFLTFAYNFFRSPPQTVEKEPPHNDQLFEKICHFIYPKFDYSTKVETIPTATDFAENVKDINQFDVLGPYGDTPLTVAIKSMNLDIAYKLIQMSPNLINLGRTRPLYQTLEMLALSSDKRTEAILSFAITLIQKGADIDKGFILTHDTPLKGCLEYDDLSKNHRLIKILILKNAIIYGEPSERQLKILVAVIQTLFDEVKFLFISLNDTGSLFSVLGRDSCRLILSKYLNYF